MEAVGALLRVAECDVNEKDESGWSALHHAAIEKRHDVVALLLKHPDICVAIVNRDLASALHYAVRGREPLTSEGEIVIDLLLAQGNLPFGHKQSSSPTFKAPPSMRSSAVATHLYMKRLIKEISQLWSSSCRKALTW